VLDEEGERKKMHPPNHKPTETYIGNTDVREDLLRQEASKRHPLSALSAMLALVLVILGVLAAVVVGLARLSAGS
jgi:hypothetical protein